MPPRTVAAAVTAARERLLAAGVPPDEAAGDAEVLARHVLGWDLTQFTLHRNDSVTGDFDRAFGDLIGRRARREPVSQIVGHREFWGLDFEVTRDVLTPRPETELVVRATLDVCARPDTPGSCPTIVDIGTGSGCIAIALATELPEARFIASDASPVALTIARRNAARHGVDARIGFVHTDCVPPEYDVDIIVSNPPYIPELDRSSLAPEVREYEPSVALFGGQDGLDFYRQLFRDVPGALCEDGWMIVEVGYDQATRVKALANPRFWSFERTYSDLQGIERVLAFKALHPPDRNDVDHGSWRY
jgi:release factor glutamine methyltransferase